MLIKRGKNASVENGTWRDLVLGQYEYEASFKGGFKSKTPLGLTSSHVSPLPRLIFVMFQTCWWIFKEMGTPNMCPCMYQVKNVQKNALE